MVVKKNLTSSSRRALGCAELESTFWNFSKLLNQISLGFKPGLSTIVEAEVAGSHEIH